MNCYTIICRSGLGTVEITKTYSSYTNSTTLVDKLSLILKLSRPRTWVFAILSFFYAYMRTSNPVMWQIFAGIAIFSLGTGATNMINAYTDIPEDLVNNPIRIDFIRRLGMKNLINATISAYVFLILLSLPFGLTFTSIILMAILVSAFYSLPPIRLKKHPILALSGFSGAVALPFLAGLAAINQLSLADPWFIIFTVFMLTYGTVKNIPDLAGDKLAGLRTTATSFKDFNKAIKVSTFLLLLPYLPLTLFIITGIFHQLYLLDIPLIAFPIYWAYKNFKTKNREALEKLHTYGFIYAVSFFLYNLMLSYPSIISASVALSTLFAIFFMSKLGIDSRIRLPFNSSNPKFKEGNYGSHRHRSSG
ncbi:MAG: UbiA family prenyltransferase [Candidatus Bathyarchaeota archaeon]